MKKGHSNFSKGLLDRINNIKSKINQGIYMNNQSNLIKQSNIKKTFFNKINNNNNNLNNGKNNGLKEKKTYFKNNKSPKIYENKIIYNANKENIPQQSLIKVNKTKYYGNIKSQLYINTENGESVTMN